MTTTIFPQSPLMSFPDLLTELATSTPMYEGTSVVGGGLFPGPVLNFVPQTATGVVVGSVVTAPANPLKESGAIPPVRLFRLHHESLHQDTFVVALAPATVVSPSTKAPRDGKAKTTAVLPVSDEGK